MEIDSENSVAYLNSKGAALIGLGGYDDTIKRLNSVNMQKI
ncbi:MAG: hypothetical protein ACRYE9_02030 [Janthinobacterium lividum]